MTDKPERTPDLLGVASRLPRGWAIIYRHFGDTDRVNTARELASLAARRGLVLLIAADPDLAIRVGADGVHWPAKRLTSRWPQNRFSLETASAHNRNELIRAARAGMHAAIVSTVFASPSPSATKPIGAHRFIKTARSAPLPVYALGGFTARTAGRLSSARTDAIAGFAAVSAIHDAWKSRTVG